MGQEQLCSVVLDLLPLYADGVCNESTRQLVEEHISICPKCRESLRALQGQNGAETIVPEVPTLEKMLKKARKRTRRRIIAAGLAVLIVCLVGMLGVNQIRQRGVAFTNVDDILTTRQALLVWQNEGAAAFMDRLNLAAHSEEGVEEADIRLEHFDYYGVYQIDSAHQDNSWNVQWFVSLSNGCQGILTLQVETDGLHPWFSAVDNSDTDAVRFFQTLNEKLKKTDQ